MYSPSKGLASAQQAALASAALPGQGGQGEGDGSLQVEGRGEDVWKAKLAASEEQQRALLSRLQAMEAALPLPLTLRRLRIWRRRGRAPSRRARWMRPGRQ